MDEVLLAVDPHKASSTVAVFDPMTRTVVAEGRFDNTAEGYQALRRFADRWPARRWAVEGCHGAGRSLAQRLVADQERVVDVPAKLAARVRVFSRGHGRKTDRDDAISIGLAALETSDLNEVRLDDDTVILRLLAERRHELVIARTRAACRLHRLLAELTPGGMRNRVTATNGAAALRRLRPASDAARVRKQIARDHLRDIEALDRRIAALDSQHRDAVLASGTSLLEIFGIGPVLAARILAEIGDIDRFATKDRFASYNGTAPIDVSSGDQQRHRLSRSGNRRLNHAIHIAAVTQIRHHHSPGRAYYDHKLTQGKTRKEALRCLKRRISDAIYRQLTTPPPTAP